MKIKSILAIAAVSMMAAGAAQAELMAFETVDADKNGLVSFEELKAVMSDVSEEAFKTADADQDGALTEAEFLVIAG